MSSGVKQTQNISITRVCCPVRAIKCGRKLWNEIPVSIQPCYNLFALSSRKLSWLSSAWESGRPFKTARLSERWTVVSGATLRSSLGMSSVSLQCKVFKTWTANLCETKSCQFYQLIFLKRPFYVQFCWMWKLRKNTFLVRVDRVLPHSARPNPCGNPLTPTPDPNPLSPLL